WGNLSRVDDLATVWPQKRLLEYLGKAFFFNPFRHGELRMPVQQTGRLTQNGSNLAQMLHTINSNDHETFQAIEMFMQEAVPDIGEPHTPLTGNQTEVTFRSPRGKYHVRLDEMGGGIEQLLMVATVLQTTGDDSPLFIEEPESHLHARAQ